MIYNLVEYVRIQLPSIRPIANGRLLTEHLAQVVFNESGGVVNHQFPRTDKTIQITSYNDSGIEGREQLLSVYSLLKNKFRLVLPEVTVDGTVYPEVIAYQVSPIQDVSYSGQDEQGMRMFDFNIVVTLQEEKSCP